MKSGGIIEENNKKKDFKNIKFRKIVKKSDKNKNLKNSENIKISKNNIGKTEENINKFENKEFDK